MQSTAHSLYEHKRNEKRMRADNLHGVVSIDSIEWAYLLTSFHLKKKKKLNGGP